MKNEKEPGLLTRIQSLFLELFEKEYKREWHLFRDLVISKTGIQYPTWYSWMKRRKKPKKLECEAIMTILDDGWPDISQAIKLQNELIERGSV